MRSLRILRGYVLLNSQSIVDLTLLFGEIIGVDQPIPIQCRAELTGLLQLRGNVDRDGEKRLAQIV